MTKKEFKQLFDQYFDAIRSYLYYKSGDENLATDIAQDVFLKVWEKQLNIKNSGIKSLLYKMATDAFITVYRKNKNAQKYAERFVLEFEQTPEEKYMYKELLLNYQKVLANLPEKQRTVFLMNRSEGLTYTEIAERLNLSVKAIEKRMKMALNTLKEKVKHKT